ncbi:MAG: hypothetical protein ACHQ7N_07145 [Candidatus Methylomirabilales bacterium]
MATPPPCDASGWAEGLERLARLIPGIGRYQDREGLRETDKLVRVHLADLLADLSRTVEGAERRLADANVPDRLPALDRVARLLNTLADRIRLASYGFAGVFDLHKIRERELAAMQRFDVGLVGTISRLRAPVQALADKTTDDTAFPQALQAVEAGLQEFERTMAERDRVARGL